LKYLVSFRIDRAIVTLIAGDIKVLASVKMDVGLSHVSDGVVDDEYVIRSFEAGLSAVANRSGFSKSARRVSDYSVTAYILDGPACNEDIAGVDAKSASYPNPFRVVAAGWDI
jgi:hypothetical protein